jgi:hypothetical protein
MADIRKQQVRTTLALAAATGGLLAAAMAGSPTARADDPFADIVSDVQNSIAIGQADYAAAATDFSTAGGTNAGLIAEFLGFDNTFISSADYVLLGLTAAATGTDFSLEGSAFDVTASLFPLTAAGEQATATADLALASEEFTWAMTNFSSGDYFAGVDSALFIGYYDVLAGQAETLAVLFSLGI